MIKFIFSLFDIYYESNSSMIEKLNRRVADLESPFLYKIGDKVIFHLYCWTGDRYNKEGIITSKEKKYEDIFKSNLVERFNTYLVYCESDKNTYSIKEDNIRINYIPKSSNSFSEGE